MTFKEAVEAAQPPVNESYRQGKQAMERGHKEHVSCQDKARLTGSIALDDVLRQQKPNNSRWDYGLGYKSTSGDEWAIWVEVHSATTREVSTVLKKLQWLKDWLNAEADQLRQLTERSNKEFRYVWIASSGVNIPRHHRQAKVLARSGLKLKGHLRLP